jgi:hypothetical protein
LDLSLSLYLSIYLSIYLSMALLDADGIPSADHPRAPPKKYHRDARTPPSMPAILLEHDQSPPPPARLAIGGASASQAGADPGMSPVTIQLLATGTVCLFLGIAFLAIRWYLHKLLHPTPTVPTSDYSSILVAFDWCVAPVHTRSRTHVAALSARAECIMFLGGCQGC